MNALSKYYAIKKRRQKGGTDVRCRILRCLVLQDADYNICYLFFVMSVEELPGSG